MSPAAASVWPMRNAFEQARLAREREAKAGQPEVEHKPFSWDDVPGGSTGAMVVAALWLIVFVWAWRGWCRSLDGSGKPE